MVSNQTAHYKNNFRQGSYLLTASVLLVSQILILSVLIAPRTHAEIIDVPPQPSLPPDTTVIVVKENTPEWTSADTRPGGEVTFVEQDNTPHGDGALKLTTDETNAAKAQLLTETDTPLKDVNALSYATKQNTASSPQGLPSYQLTITDLEDWDETGITYTNLVYEPYWNLDPEDPDANSNVLPGTWQTWNVLDGLFWSSKSAGGLEAGAGGPPLYSINYVLLLNPNARVISFGVNIGSYNPSYDVDVDMLRFNNVFYDFEPLSSTSTTTPPAQNNPGTPATSSSNSPTTPIVLASSATTTTGSSSVPAVLSDTTAKENGGVTSSTNTTDENGVKAAETTNNSPDDSGLKIWWLLFVILALIGALYAWWRHRKQQEQA